VTDETITIRPQPRSIMPPTTARVTLNAVVSVIASWRSQAAGSNS
jgi:hypothetical protein